MVHFIALAVPTSRPCFFYHVFAEAAACHKLSQSRRANHHPRANPLGGSKILRVKSLPADVCKTTSPLDRKVSHRTWEKLNFIFFATIPPSIVFNVTWQQSVTILPRQQSLNQDKKRSETTPMTTQTVQHQKLPHCSWRAGAKTNSPKSDLASISSKACSSSRPLGMFFQTVTLVL